MESVPLNENEGRKIRECWPHVAFEILGTEWFREKIDREWVKKELLQKNKDIEDWGDSVSHLEFDHALHLCLHSSPSALLRFLEVDSFSRSPTHYRGKGVFLVQVQISNYVKNHRMKIVTQFI